MPPKATDVYREQLTVVNRLDSQCVPNTMITTKQKSGRSFDKKNFNKNSNSDLESLLGSSYFKSDRTADGSVETRKSIVSVGLSEFYSSRRSLASLQERSHSIANSLALEKQSQLTDRAWNDNEGQKPDTSPRRPTKRHSLNYCTDEESAYQPHSKNIDESQRNITDAAPRQPQSRTLQVDPPCQVDCTDSPPRRPSNLRLHIGITSEFDQRDSSPRKPSKRMSITGDDNSYDYELYTPIATNPSPKVDAIPQQPRQQWSFSERHTVNTENKFNNASDAIQKDIIHKEIIVEIPTEEMMQHTSTTSYEGSGISVTSDLSCQSNDGKLYSRLKMTVPSNHCALHQRNLLLRRQNSQKSNGSSFSLVKSITTRDTDGSGSIMSIQSHLSLSMKIRSLIELAADVVNSESLDDAAKHYQKAIHAAGSEIMNINIHMGNIIGQDSSSSVAARNGCHEDLRLIGIIIGLLRTKMALLYGGIGEYERAIDLCKGAVQVHRHQPVLKSVSSNLSDINDVAGLMVLIIERLEKSQICFESHKELLDMIDKHSGHDIHSETDASSRIIVHDMLENSTDKSLNIQHDVLEVLSVHTARQNKHDEGIMYLRDALQIHLVSLGLKHPHTSSSLIDVARMYRGFGNDRNNESLVLGYFQQTAEVLQRSNLSQESRASVLNDIAVIHMRRKRFDEAIKFLLDALHAYDESEKDDTVTHEHHIATLQIWRNLGECYMQLFKFKSAEGALLKALHIQRDCVKIHETAEKLEISAMKVNESLLKLSNDICIADTICQIGKARAGGGSNKQALDIYREALRVLNRNASADPDRSDTELLKKRDQLTHLLYCIAEAERDIEEFEKSLQMYLLSLRLRKYNGAEDRDKRKATRIHCLSCFLGIIDIFIKQKKFDEAKNQIREAMAYTIQCRVKKTHPLVLAIRKKAKDCEQAISEASMRNPDIDALEKKADAEIERGALDMATETLRHLLVIRRATLKEMKARGEDTKDQVYAIACLLQTFGFVFAKNGDDENAERAFKDASRLFRKGGSPNEIPQNDPNLVHI